MTVRNLTVKERILLHLLEHDRYREDYTVPIAVTQTGIANSVGIRIQHVTQYTTPLDSEGVLLERKAHIEGGSRRRKTYFLTPLGRNRAAALQRSLLEEVVSFRTRTGEVTDVSLTTVRRERPDATLLDLLKELDLNGYLTEVSEEGLPTRDDTQEAPQIDAFYGRNAELDRVKRHLELGRTVTVLGPAGIGKTALGARVCETFRGRGSLFWRRVRPWDTAMDLFSRLASFLKGLGRENLHGYLLGRGSKTLGRVEDLVQRDVAGLQAILIFDDVHEASEEAESFFSILFQGIRDEEGASMLLLSRRSPASYGQKEVAAEGSVVEVLLGALDEESRRAFLADIGVPEEEADRMAVLSGGHPLFLKILSRRGRGGMREAADSLQAFVHEEIEPTLSEEERGCMQIASMYEVPVPREGLLLEAPSGLRTLLALEKSGLIDRIGPGHYVLHDFLRSYFAEGLSPERRDAILDKAVPWLNSTAKGFESEGRLEEARGLLENAVRLDPDPKRRRESLESLGDVRYRLGLMEGALYAFRQALEAAEAADTKARLHRKLADTYELTHRVAEADREIRAGLQLLGSAPSLEGAWLLNMRAYAAVHHGHDYEAAHEDVDRVLGWTEGQIPEDLSLVGSLKFLLGILHLVNPKRRDLAEAQRCFEEALGIREAIGEVSNIPGCLANIGLVRAFQGQLEAASDSIERSVALAEASGDIWSLGGTKIVKAWFSLHFQEDYTTAETLLWEVFESYRKTEFREGSAWIRKLLSDLRRCQGRYAEARAQLELFFDEGTGIISPFRKLENLALMSRLCSLSGDHEAAAANLAQARDLFSEESAPWLQFHLRWAEGVLNAQVGDVERARESFQLAGRPPRYPEEIGTILHEFLGSCLDPEEFYLDHARFLASVGDSDQARKVAQRTLRASAKGSRTPWSAKTVRLVRSLEGR